MLLWAMLAATGLSCMPGKKRELVHDDVTQPANLLCQGKKPTRIRLDVRFTSAVPVYQPDIKNDTTCTCSILGNVTDNVNLRLSFPLLRFRDAKGNAARQALAKIWCVHAT